MPTATLFLAVSAAVVFNAGIASAQHASHSDTWLGYKTCDDSSWKLYWNGNNFTHENAANGKRHGETYAWYKTFDGTCWKLEWDDANKRFRHTSQAGQSHTDHIMNYLTWDNTKWTAVRV